MLDNKVNADNLSWFLYAENNISVGCITTDSAAINFNFMKLFDCK